MITDHDLYYLRSCLRNLRQFHSDVMDETQMVTLGSEVLSDNIEWLDAFIDRHERTASADTHPEGGDEGNTSAPFMSGAVPPQAGDAQNPTGSPS